MRLTFEFTQLSFLQCPQHDALIPSSAHKADAVWLHVSNYGNRLDRLNNPPPVRPTNKPQVWIAACLEWEGVSCQEARYGLDGYVNWTMNFRRDADIWWPYGYAFRTPDYLLKPLSLWDRKIGRIVRRVRLWSRLTVAAVAASAFTYKVET